MIFYFSGTGNSLYAARLLANELNDTVISIPECINSNKFKFELKDSEKVGIVTPVYFYGLPSIVEDFLDKADFTKSSLIYLVVTFGSFTANTGKKKKKYLSEKGLSLDYIFSIHMPENYVPLFKVPSKETCQSLIANAKNSVVDIAKILNENPPGDYDTHKGRFPSAVSSLCRMIYKKGMTTKKFWVDDSCTGCRLCERICPSNVILFHDGKPCWSKETCPRCLACLHRCPSSAIQFGHFTKKKDRYVNPNVEFDL